MSRLWLQMLSGSLCSALSDLPESPLLHILQLVCPLEPKQGVEMVRGGLERKNVLKSRGAVFICTSLGVWRGGGGCYARARWPFLLGSFSWFYQVPLLQALEAILEDAALWLRRHDITTGKGGAGKSSKANVTRLPILTQIIGSHSHQRGSFKYYFET